MRWVRRFVCFIALFSACSLQRVKSLIIHLDLRLDYKVATHRDKAPIWQWIVKQHGLVDYSFEEAVSWPFGEAIFNIEYDIMSDTTKSRRYGFLEWVDTEEMLFRLFSEFQKMRFIPTL